MVKRIDAVTDAELDAVLARHARTCSRSRSDLPRERHASPRDSRWRSEGLLEEKG